MSLFGTQAQASVLPWRSNTSRMANTDIEAELYERAYSRQAFRLDLSPKYLADGNPTIGAGSSRGFLSSISDRWDRGSGTVGDHIWAKTGVQVFNDLFDEDRGPIGAVVNGDTLLYKGNQIPLGEATAEQVLETADPAFLSFYAANGISKEKIVKLVDNDPYRLQEWHREYTEFHETDMRLNNYAQEHAIASFGSGLVAFAGDVITDPVNLVSFGAGGLASSAGRAVGRNVLTRMSSTIARVGGSEATQKAITRQLAARANRFVVAARQSPVYALLEQATPIQRQWAKRVFTGSIGAEAAMFDVVSQIAEHDTALQFALTEEDDFEWNPWRTMGAGLAGMALAATAARGFNMRELNATAREFISHNKSHPVSDYFITEIEAKRMDPDAPLDLDMVDTMEGITNYVVGNYKFDQVDETMAILHESGVFEHKFGASYMANYMSKKPSRDELIRHLGESQWKRVRDSKGRFTKVDNPDARVDTKTPDTAYWTAKKQFLAAQELKIAARQSGNIKELARANNALRDSFQKLEEARALFRTRQARPNEKLPKRVQEWLKDDSQPALVYARRGQGAQSRAYRVVTEAMTNEKILGYLPTAWIQRQLRRVAIGDRTAQPNKLIKDGAVKQDPVSRLYVSLRATLDDAGINAYVRNAEGQQVMPTYRRMERLRGERDKLLKRLEQKWGTKDFASHDGPEIAGRDILHRLVYGEEIPEEFADIAEELRAYLDKMAIRGNDAGVLHNLIEDYIPVKLYRDITSQKKPQLIRLLSDYWKREFIPSDTNVNPPVHLKALHAMDMDDVEIKGYTRFLDLNEEDRIRYVYELNRTDFFEVEASAAIHKKLGEAESEDGLWESLAKESVTTDVAQSRRIDQKFWYSQEVLDLGVVDTNINRLTQDYERIIGYQIAQQETMNEMFGEVVTFRQAVNTLVQLAKETGQTDLGRMLVSELQDVDNVAAMRKGSIGGENAFIQGANSFARAITYGAVPATILLTEGSVAAARALGTGNIRRMAQAFRVMSHGLSRSEMRRMGLAMELEWDSSRYFGSIEDLHSERTAGRLRGLLRATENRVRELGGERIITQRLKALHYHLSHSVMYEYRNRLDRIMAFDGSQYDLSTKEGLKAFRQAAKDAGFGSRFDHAEMLTRFGVISEDTRAGVQWFAAKDKNLFIDPNKMALELANIDDISVRRSAEVFLERLSVYAQDDMESFVTTASANSMLRSDNPIANAFLMYTTFPFAFIQKSMSRAFRAPAAKQWGYLAAFGFGELMTHMFRRSAYGGENPADVVEDVVNDPVTSMATVLMRSPVAGPFNLVADLAASAFAPSGLQTFGGAAGPSRVVSAGRSAIQGAQSLFTEEGFDEDHRRRSANNTPFLNMWYARVPLSLTVPRKEDDVDLHKFQETFDVNGVLPPYHELEKMLKENR